MSTTTWFAAAFSRLSAAGFIKTPAALSITALAISMLSALPGNAGAQTIETCKTPESQARRKTVKLEKITSIEDLLRQVRDGMKNDILCLEPEDLQQGWGTTIWGDWRGQKNVLPISELWPIPLTLAELKARVDANPMEKYRITYHRATREKHPEIAQPNIQLSIYRFSNNPFISASGDLVPLPRLGELFGEPTNFSTRDPVPSDRNPPKRSGPYPYYNAVWKKSNPDYRVSVGTHPDSDSIIIFFY
jgi:hypothetical protein